MFLMTMEQKTTLEKGRNQERLRISEELHDGILPRLFSVRIRWGHLQLRGTKENLRRHRKFLRRLETMEDEIRNISHDLRNDLIWKELSFMGELEDIIKDRSELGNFKYSFHYLGIEAWEKLDYRYIINIIRMMDEMLQNIIKHAEASEVNIRLGVSENTFTIVVNDNGKGFRPETTKSGNGLKNLHDRAKKINGESTIQSKVGKGTTVLIQFTKTI